MGKANRKVNNAKIKEREQEAHIVRKIVLSIFSVVTVALIGMGIAGYFYINSALKPVDKKDETKVKVTVPIGSSVRNIASILEEKGIIKDSRVFRYYVKFKNESGFQAGDYQLSPSMEFNEIIEQLKTGKVMKEALFSITIPEGKQVDEIATIISKKTNYSQKEILEKLDNPKYIQSLIKQYPTILTDEILNNEIRHPLEGYLFPATYKFYEEEPKLEDIIETMLSKTDDIVSDYKDQMVEKKLSVHRFMTMASLIEEEATEQSDRENIAAVFYNRLAKKMPLQTDPTILYALGKHQVQITYDDLAIDSPYNTYVNKGLPPSPIASPGEKSMVAVLNPKESNYVYFYSRPNGETIFTASLVEHNNIKNKYKHEWDEFKENN